MDAVTQLAILTRRASVMPSLAGVVAARTGIGRGAGRQLDAIERLRPKRFRKIAARSAGGQAAFRRVRDQLVERAGGVLSLSEAAARIGTTWQALHDRIATGGALGMMRGREIALPVLQFAERGSRIVILPGIDSVTRLFRQAEAGPWMALQFLVDPDPNLCRPPIDALREGDRAAVERAARAYLHLDEE